MRAPLHVWYAVGGGVCVHRQSRLTRNKHTQDKCLLCWFLCVCSSTLIQWSEEEIVQRGFKQHRPPLSFHLETNLAYHSEKKNTVVPFKATCGKSFRFLFRRHKHDKSKQRKGTGVIAGGEAAVFVPLKSSPRKPNMCCTVDEAVAQSYVNYWRMKKSIRIVMKSSLHLESYSQGL